MNLETRVWLAPHARLRDDPISGKRVLLYPEGALELGETAAAVIDLCGCGMTVSEILCTLSDAFQGSPEDMETDVTTLLGELSSRGLIKRSV